MEKRKKWVLKTMFDKLLMYNVNKFSMFISNFDFALTTVLGSNDDYYNKIFLSFLENAWILHKNAS